MVVVEAGESRTGHVAPVVSRIHPASIAGRDSSKGAGERVEEGSAPGRCGGGADEILSLPAPPL